jgi:hypothetical protein
MTAMGSGAMGDIVGAVLGFDMRVGMGTLDLTGN